GDRPRLGRRQGRQRQARGAFRLDHHHHLAGHARRRGAHAHHQPPRSRHRRSEQDRGARRGERRPDARAQDDEPVLQLRSPHRRRPRRGGLRAEDQDPAGEPGHALDELMTQTLKTKVLIIGAGTGGYVAGIRCGQLGLETVLVDGGDGLGGTCLNVGCIPSKAIIHAAGKYETVAKAASGDGALGITASAPAIDLSKTVAWKDGVVKKLNAGVAALLKKAKVKVVKGWAEFSDAKTCTVKTDDGDLRIT